VEKERITLLMVSHDPLVDQYAHLVLALKDGNLADAVHNPN
jgi:ABC-type lipoprotein export system ATPase subunit